MIMKNKLRFGTMRSQEALGEGSASGTVKVISYLRFQDCGISAKDRGRCRLEPVWTSKIKYVCCGWQSYAVELTKPFRIQRIISESQVSDSELFTLLKFNFALR